MKRVKFLISIFMMATVGAFFNSCVSPDYTARVQRVDADTVTDYSGNWNDTDVKIVAETLVSECLSSNAVIAFNAVKKRPPVVIVGTFANKSDEHIDTSIISKKFEYALINSGKVGFVASASERGEIREERADQQVNSSEETAASLGNETGADFMLIGTVKTIVDSNGYQTARVYYVNAEMIDIETNRKLWAGEDSSIKKIIRTPAVRR